MPNAKTHLLTGLLIGAAINLAFQLTDPKGILFNLPEPRFCLSAPYQFPSVKSAKSVVFRFNDSTIQRFNASMLKTFPTAFPLRPLRPSREALRPSSTLRLLSVTYGNR